MTLFLCLRLLPTFSLGPLGAAAHRRHSDRVAGCRRSAAAVSMCHLRALVLYELYNHFKRDFPYSCILWHLRKYPRGARPTVLCYHRRRLLGSLRAQCVQLSMVQSGSLKCSAWEPDAFVGVCLVASNVVIWRGATASVAAGGGVWLLSSGRNHVGRHAYRLSLNVMRRWYGGVCCARTGGGSRTAGRAVCVYADSPVRGDRKSVV